ncbi:MAG: extracellular solute-binding protein [Firmicutes bacterium]|nr:extracellular solute-binding protein [Bacillota bacterium]
MSTIKKILSLTLVLVLCLGIFTGCGGSSTDSDNPVAGKSVSVITREDGSGTRDAFVEITGVLEKDANGEKVDYTTLSAEITNSTAVMMTTVAGNTSSIGYISLGSLNDTVKAVAVDGVEATAENVKNGSYTVSRPFNIVTKGDLSAEATDFMNFILSADGQAIVEESGYVAVNTGEAYQPSGLSGKVVVAGSSSVTPVMTKLAEAYMALNSGVTVEVEQSDSTTGVTSTIEGICDIGMASRAVKDEEKAQGVTETTIAMDGIAVIVNLKNPVTDLTTEMIKNIYKGDITSWDEIMA